MCYVDRSGHRLPSCVGFVLLILAWTMATPQPAHAQFAADPLAASAPVSPALAPLGADPAFVPGNILVAFRSTHAAERVRLSSLAAETEVAATIDLRRTATTPLRRSVSSGRCRWATSRP